MSQMKTGDIITLKATASISAYSIVGVDTTGLCSMPATNTVAILGVSQDLATTNGATGICINGTSKVTAGLSITAGDPIAAQTGGTGKAVVGTTTAATVGIALENGSTNSVIEVSIQPRRLI